MSTTPTPLQDPLGLEAVFGKLRHNWGWLLALGLLFILLGAVGLFMTAALTLVSVLYFGVLLLIGGGFQVAQAIKCHGWRAILAHVLIALLYLAAGIIIVVDPVLASVTFTMLLAVFIIAAGIVRLLMAWQLRSGTRVGLLVLGGVIAIVLGIVILAAWPVSGLTVIGLFVAIELIFHGFAYTTLALSLRPR